MRRSLWFGSIAWGVATFVSWVLALVLAAGAGLEFWIDGRFWVGCADRVCETAALAWLLTIAALAAAGMGWASFRQLRHSRGGDRYPSLRKRCATQRERRNGF